ncbi:MAG: putative Peptidoglycan glycosyltransferase [Candidatus Saccharibacteria bacterium]|nr:putative Peptidoglycan glycosyltransferase [Candidatus Saccharibacteria bacterium]
MPAVTPYRNDRPSRPSADIKPVSPVKRARIIYNCLLFLTVIFVVRLFYLQVIKHDFYRKAALQSQLKQYEIPAERGTIYAYDGDQSTPLVLNEKKYTLFADPKYVKDSLKEASAITKIIGGDTNKVSDLLKTPGLRYVVLAKKLNKDQSDKLNKLDFNGVGTREESYRTYPDGTLAAQLLGFVNDEGKGQYGLEENLNDKLDGTPGELKAITDAQGVPLVSNKDNIQTDPKAGDKIQLTVDIGAQRQLEDILKAGLDHAKSKSGSAMIMDVNTGAIKAMANYPTYDPSKIADISDLSALSNAVVSSPLEVGSIMKPLTAGAAIDRGVITKDTTYYDPAKIPIDGYVVSNVEEDGGPGTKSIADLLRLSLNTGAVYMLQQMGGGQINKQARDVWHDYMVNHYGFGTRTGIEQAGETKGVVPDPDSGNGLNITYANTAFGQGMSATILQMAGAYAGAVNGGIYYQPHVVESTTDFSGKKTAPAPKVLRQTVSAKTSADVATLMEGVFTSNHAFYGMPHMPDGYIIGGKTGSAQIANPAGGYYTDRFTGTFAGFVGGDKPQYVILVRVNEPGIGGFAGAQTAAPIFSNLATMLINNYGVNPKK